LRELVVGGQLRGRTSRPDERPPTDGNPHTDIGSDQQSDSSLYGYSNSHAAPPNANKRSVHVDPAANFDKHPDNHTATARDERRRTGRGLRRG
jgi:hypothetical protein